jgi:hypothetical protein
VVHHTAIDDPAIAAVWARTLVAASDQLLGVRRFGDVSVAVLAPEAPAVELTTSTAVPAGAITARASHSGDRIPMLFDGDLDTRWMSGVPQHGDEWITLDFDRPRDIAAVGLRMAERSVSDYPRDLSVESLHGGQTTALFHGTVLPALARGLAADGRYPPVTIALPRNQSTSIRLKQLGTTRRLFWSIHELEVWERR